MKEVIDSIKVRMYRQGFGDCFLLQFMKGQKRISSMLIDCGVKLHSRDKNGQEPLMAVVEDITAVLLDPKSPTEDASPVLDLLVVTHAHWDHVSGFHPSYKYFEKFRVGQVWLAWTEDPLDPVARQINTHLSRNARALRIAFDTIRDITRENEIKTRQQYKGKKRYANQQNFLKSLEELLNFNPFSKVPNANDDVLAATIKTQSGIRIDPNYKPSPDTEEAFNFVKETMVNAGAGIRYHTPGNTVEDGSLFPGIRFYVLGPPKNALINKDKPSGGTRKETYFTVSDASLNGFTDGLLAAEALGTSIKDQNQSDNGAPFDGEYKWKRDSPLISTLYDAYRRKEADYRTIEYDWLGIASALALQMDSYTNNTSLVLAIEFVESGKVLLFPGDAQVGSWLSWHDLAFRVSGSGGLKTVTMEDLFARTVLYKVSHHASHNATLRDAGLERMTSPDLVALVPEKEKAYSGIPYPPLVERLHQLTRGRLIFSSDANHPAEKVLKSKPTTLSKPEWKAFKEQTRIEELYIEFTILA